MGRLILPHAVTRRLATDVIDAATLVFLGVGYGEPEAFQAQIYPMKATAAYEAGGTAGNGVELSRPHGILWGTDDPGRFPTACLVQFNGRTFKVVSPTMTHEFGGAANNCTAVMEELEAVPEGGE